MPLHTQLYPVAADNRREALALAAELIAAGQLVAFPTETVYGLGADALNPAAAARIYAAKGRPSDNPLIVHVAGRSQVESLAARVPDAALRLMDAFWPGPLTIVLPKRPIVPDAVTGGMDTVALRMPDHPLALELIAASRPLAAPSANRSGLPSPTRAEHVYRDLAGRIPLILDGGPCRVGVESTVISLVDEPIVLRPGGVTPEMLARAIGPVRVHESALAPLQGRALSPGMKYQHYAPRAQVLIADGPDTPRRIREQCARDEAAGLHPVVLALDEDRAEYRGLDLVPLGSRARPESVAAALFDALRRCDELGADRVYAETVPAEGVGLAVMNRLLRAAGFRHMEG